MRQTKSSAQSINYMEHCGEHAMTAITRTCDCHHTHTQAHCRFAL